MKIFEFADLDSDKASRVDSAKLLGLAEFIQGRNTDENAKSQISAPAFIKMAQSLGLNVNESNIAEIVGQDPLDKVFQPFDQSTGYLIFKRGSNGDFDMPVNKAQDIVAKAADRQLKTSI